MAFAAGTWQAPTDGLNDLEQRIAAALPRSVRVSCPAMNAGTEVDITVTWPTPFPDASYTVVATTQEAVASAYGSGAMVRKIVSKTASAAVIRVANYTGNSGVALAAGQALLHAVAIHD
jgi:hypothetical protein